MNKAARELLEHHFNTAFAAPDGIKKLRELILTLAMQGKLVAQDPNDQPASELLREIEADKQRLVKKGKIKAPKSLPPIKPEEIPYALPGSDSWQAPSKFHCHPGVNPGHWVWVRLGQIADYNGRENVNPDSISQDDWILDLEDIEKGTSRLIYRAKYFERQSKSTKSVFRKGDVLYGKLRPYLDKVLVAESDGFCTTEIVPIVSNGAVDPQYLRWLLKRPQFLEHVNSLMYGVKMPRLGTEQAVNSIHPLPPMAEQHRIVAKIDQLMSRCDELEKLRAEREQRRISIHTAAINRLLSFNGEITPEAPSNEAWQFITQHFPELYAVKPNVTELRKAILQLAVMGKLVPQNPNDPPASELLKEIEAEKQRLVKEGKIKVSKPLPAIKPEEIPYPVPSGWEWIRLGDIVDFKTGKLDSNAAVEGGKYPFFTCAKEILQIDTYAFDCEAVLLAGNNAAGKYDVKHYSGKFNAYQRTYVITTEFGHTSAVGYGYLKQTLVNMLDDLQAKSLGTLTRFLTLGILKPIYVPLPPIPEQNRIVAKIDQLMAFCDSLEQQIDAATGKQTELLNALMAKVSGE